ncbi:unnamed protein product, partial [Prorocentrum cordatum]
CPRRGGTRKRRAPPPCSPTPPKRARIGKSRGGEGRRRRRRRRRRSLGKRGARAYAWGGPAAAPTAGSSLRGDAAGSAVPWRRAQQGRGRGVEASWKEAASSRAPAAPSKKGACFQEALHLPLRPLCARPSAQQPAVQLGRGVGGDGAGVAEAPRPGCRPRGPAGQALWLTLFVTFSDVGGGLLVATAKCASKF